MKISHLRTACNTPFLHSDINGRSIHLYEIDKAELVGNMLYPNSLVYCHFSDTLYNPINERTMSLGDDDQKEFDLPSLDPIGVVETPVFFFLYNTDNYYHFVYDTLPYLISYFEAKKTYPNLKLLVTFPNAQSGMYNFVKEFLELAGISKSELEFAQNDVIYEKIVLSDSYTHGHDSNLSPRREVYSFLKELADKVEPVTSFGDKIYISRRSWLHNDTSNMGTNYTTRRKLKNENELVDFLASVGYNEVFTELLSTREKLGVFKQTKSVVGAIGGGMCNVLFCPWDTRVECIVSPYFLDINARFKYCFNANTRYWHNTKHTETGYFKKYMRVRFGDGDVGEIHSIKGNHAFIAYSDSKVAGWNSDVFYELKKVPLDDLNRIDEGLNSEWYMNLNKFKRVVK